MWILIALIVIVVISIAVYIFDPRIFVTVTSKGEDNYLLEFENGEEPVCKLIHKTIHNGKEYLVFVPLESLSNIPDEDIITLRFVKQKGASKKYIFDADYELCLKIKNTLANRYNFAD